MRSTRTALPPVGWATGRYERRTEAWRCYPYPRGGSHDRRVLHDDPAVAPGQARVGWGEQREPQHTLLVRAGFAIGLHSWCGPRDGRFAHELLQLEAVAKAAVCVCRADREPIRELPLHLRLVR